MDVDNSRNFVGSFICHQLTDASLAAIGETCKGLTSFDMRSNRSMTHAGIASLRQKCSQIVSINSKGY